MLPLFGEYERRRSLPSDIVDHLPELYHWARGWPFAHIAELGTGGASRGPGGSGNSTSALLAGVEVTGRGHVWSFDIEPPDVPDAFRESEHWTFTLADALREKALAEAPAELDVLFVDLDPHSFEQTLTALTLWVPRVRRGGVVLLHDTEYGTPAAAFYDPHESAVGKALDVYCAMKDLAWENRPGCHGLGVLRIR